MGLSPTSMGKCPLKNGGHFVQVLIYQFIVDRVTHICVDNLIMIGSDNGLPPGRRQAIIWTSARILLIWPLGTNISEILIQNQTFSLKKMHFNMSSAECPFGLGLNVLNSFHHSRITWCYDPQHSGGSHQLKSEMFSFKTLTQSTMQTIILRPLVTITWLMPNYHWYLCNVAWMGKNLQTFCLVNDEGVLTAHGYIHQSE